MIKNREEGGTLDSSWVWMEARSSLFSQGEGVSDPSRKSGGLKRWKTGSSLWGKRASQRRVKHYPQKKTTDNHHLSGKPGMVTFKYMSGGVVQVDEGLSRIGGLLGRHLFPDERVFFFESRMKSAASACG